MYVTDIVTVAQPDELKNTFLDPNLFNFGDSPISEDWKKRLSQKLAERGTVFSPHEWEVGPAKGVEHQIRLNDARPFRERSRSLTPADIDVLAAGIIKGSQSPFASAIVMARKKKRQYPHVCRVLHTKQTYHF